MIIICLSDNKNNLPCQAENDGCRKCNGEAEFIDTIGNGFFSLPNHTVEALLSEIPDSMINETKIFECKSCRHSFFVWLKVWN